MTSDNELNTSNGINNESGSTFTSPIAAQRPFDIRTSNNDNKIFNNFSTTTTTTTSKTPTGFLAVSGAPARHSRSQGVGGAFGRPR